MKIAVINETSAADRNAVIVAALEGRGHTIINAGMTKSGDDPELTYIHTGFLAALFLNTGRADLVVGGCGTGAGFMLSAMQYPSVYCGLIRNALDAWLFGQINGGNCISLPLLYEHGWAGDVNLKFAFDKLFDVEFGSGYPPHRKDSQKQSRSLLTQVSALSHKSFAEITAALPDAVAVPALTYPGIDKLIDPETLNDQLLAAELKKRMQRGTV